MLSRFTNDFNLLGSNHLLNGAKEYSCYIFNDYKLLNPDHLLNRRPG